MFSLLSISSLFFSLCVCVCVCVRVCGGVWLFVCYIRPHGRHELIAVSGFIVFWRAVRSRKHNKSKSQVYFTVPMIHGSAVHSENRPKKAHITFTLSISHARLGHYDSAISGVFSIPINCVNYLFFSHCLYIYL